MAKDKNKGALLRLKGEVLFFQLVGFCVVLPMGLMTILCASMIPDRTNSSIAVTAAGITGVMTLVGLGLIAHGARKKGIIRRFQDYMLHFNSSGSDSIQDLAGAMGLPVRTAINCLEELMRYGFFPGSYINQAELRLIMPHALTKEKPSAVRAVTCPHCGASAAVPAGTAVQCEYCGSMIS